ncbi:hypothetical protein N2152v2_001600 [Parachlorella kessleri]
MPVHASTIINVVLAAVLVTQAAAAVAPWYERTAEIVAVLQRDPSLQVAVKDDSTDQGSTIKISVQLQDAGRMGLANPATTQAKAKALATLLPLYGNADLDGGTVSVEVIYNGNTVPPKALPKTVDDALTQAKRAMTGNKLFVRGFDSGAPGPMGHMLVIKAKVVQYSVDDISKLGGKASVLASDALSNVYGINALDGLNLDGHISVSNVVCPDTGCP